MCGEQVIEWLMWRAAPGSSPRVRGADEHELAVDADHGIIPACAGSS